jgi:general secretion pathway protein G
MKHKGWMLLALLTLFAVTIFVVFSSFILRPSNKRHWEEAILKEDLHVLRSAIDQYTQDKRRGPNCLDDLITAGYLRDIPSDPFTGSRLTWKAIPEEDFGIPRDIPAKPPKLANPPGIVDVHSGSNQISCEGTAYSTW